MGFKLDCTTQQLRARPRFRAVIMLERMELGCNARNERTMTTMRRTHATTVDKLTLLAYGNPMWKDTLADTCGKRYRRRGKREWPRLEQGSGDKLEHHQDEVWMLSVYPECLLIVTLD